MRQVDVHEAKSQLSRLLEEVERGAEITFARNGVPVARLSKISAPVRGGFGSVREFLEWTPERLKAVEVELSEALTMEAVARQADLTGESAAQLAAYDIDCRAA